MGKVYITGDTHSFWMERLNMNVFPEQKEMTKDDYVIICGDFGVWDNSKREKYNLDWLESKNFSTLFVDGNHSNFDILDNLPVEEWNGGKISRIRPSVIHLKRGEIFNINGKKFFTFGGASSHDISDGILDPVKDKDLIKKWNKDYTKMFRVNHVSWWSCELPSQEEMDNGFKNLEKHNWTVDYVITHSPPASVLALIGHGIYDQDILTKYLEDVRSRINFKRHYMGHMHINRQLNERDILLYEQIIRIV